MNEATIRRVKVKEKYAKKLNKRGIVIGAINDKDKIVAYKSAVNFGKLKSLHQSQHKLASA